MSVFPFSPEDWLNKTRGLTLEERGAYIDLIAEQMRCDGPIPNDMKWISHLLHVSKRKAEAVLKGLIGVKLHETDAGIINERCVREIAERRARREQRAMARASQPKPVAVEDADFEQVIPAISRSTQRRLSAGSATSRQRPNAENLKNTNEIKETVSISSDSRVGARADSNITSLREVDTVVEIESPLCPPQAADAARGGVPAVADAPSESVSRKPRVSKPLASERDTTAALDLYNKAADHWGFHRCRVLEGQRRLRFRARLSEIGGVENFRLALRQIGKNDFLMGRAKGHEDFRLDLDKLLQDRGRMGDVLASLIDAAASGAVEPRETVQGKGWGWWRGKEDMLRGLTEAQWQAAIAGNSYDKGWPWWNLGAPPGHAECVVPQALIERNNLKRFAGA